MALPKLLQKLFQNNGAGPKLREDIIPIDSALSDTSTNGVQNKIVKAAIQAVADVCYQVGDLRLYAGTDVPDGWFRCDGSTIADMATNYPKLYAVLGTNVLPNYTGRVPLGASSDINTAVQAGLPNITGQVTSDDKNYYWGAGTTASGAFANAHNGGLHIGEDPWLGTRGNGFTFDASRSSAIYGKSTTVTPPSVKVAVLIRHD